MGETGAGSIFVFNFNNNPFAKVGGIQVSITPIISTITIAAS